jgi:hypothetical protein
VLQGPHRTYTGKMEVSRSFQMFFQVLRIRDVYPDTESDFIPYRIPDSGSTRSRIPDPDPQEKNLGTGIFKPKTRSGMFFPDTGSGYLPIPDLYPGAKKATDPRVVDPDGPASIWLCRIHIENADPVWIQEQRNW